MGTEAEARRKRPRAYGRARPRGTNHFPAVKRRHFTHYWAHRDNPSLDDPGARYTQLDHTAGSQFVTRGVKPGDIVYVICVRQGSLLLIGKLEVGDVVRSVARARRILRYEPWHAPEHIIASRCTRLQMRELPLAAVRRLRFVSSPDRQSPKFARPGVLDRQTLRGVRELEEASAAELDEYLPKMEPFNPSSRSVWRGD